MVNRKLKKHGCENTLHRMAHAHMMLISKFQETQEISWTDGETKTSPPPFWSNGLKKFSNKYPKIKPWHIKKSLSTTVFGKICL